MAQRAYGKETAARLAPFQGDPISFEIAFAPVLPKLFGMDEGPSDIVSRKRDHLAVVLERDVGFGGLTTGLEKIRFMPNALPEIDYRAVDLSTTLLGIPLAAPLIINSMTGGPEKAATINLHLTEAAAHLGIAMAVGSQRVALEDKGQSGFSPALRRAAPNIPLFANLGAAQIRGPKGVDRARAALDMIAADGLFIHLNPVQEAIQNGGDTDWTGVISGLERLVSAGIPIAVKEVGFGLSPNVVRRLVEIGVRIIDVAGAGGTNWARVEGFREGHLAQRAALFTEWGLPTASAIRHARAIAPSTMLIGSGGIKTAHDVAAALRLGADLVGQAAASLSAALESTEAVVAHFQEIIEGLRTICFATGSADIASLKSAPLIEDA
nr:type 2 isopentenyl-diphosphate Delta-isomerase [Parvularcula bermudensis]